MAIGLIGQKCGMTRIFTEDGRSIPVTVISIHPNRVIRMKSVDSDGYNAVQIAYGHKKVSKVNKSLQGQYAKAGVEPGLALYEFKYTDEEANSIKVGGEFDVSLFDVGIKVDVTANSKGKGFAGVIKRHNFHMQDATHGNSLSHRAPGSIGQCQDPGRVFKGKKMAGHLGNVQNTIQNQEIVKIDKERNLLFIKGAVPGYPGAIICVKPAVKIRRKV